MDSNHRTLNGKIIQMKSKKSNLKRMDNVGIVVESLDKVVSFFTELGLQLEGRAMVEGEWAGRVTGLGDQRVEIAMIWSPRMDAADSNCHVFSPRL